MLPRHHDHDHHDHHHYDLCSIDAVEDNLVRNNFRFSLRQACLTHLIQTHPWIGDDDEDCDHDGDVEKLRNRAKLCWIIIDDRGDNDSNHDHLEDSANDDESDKEDDSDDDEDDNDDDDEDNDDDDNEDNDDDNEDNDDDENLSSGGRLCGRGRLTLL